ncbi:MAG: choice-of-anchor Q domain-containing protein [Thermomicrobiales bacterium]
MCGSGATCGGGIDNAGTLTVTSSTVTDNVSPGLGTFGAGIYNEGTLVVTASTLSHNTALGFGVGILNSGTLTVDRSTFLDNVASVGNGGGVENSGTLTVVNSTFDTNQAQVGGAIDMFGGTTSVTNSTIAYNFANSSSGGGGLANSSPSGTLTVTNTIVASNTDTNGGNNCKDAIANGGHNVQFGDPVGSCGLTIAIADPKLSLLASNGGPTQTLALRAGSAAIDTGDDTICNQIGAGKVNGVDQRGVHRPQGAHCDIGAFELQPPPPPLPNPQPVGPLGGHPSPLPPVPGPAGPHLIATPAPLPPPRP